MKKLLSFIIRKLPKVIKTSLIYSDAMETMFFIVDYYKAKDHTHCSLQDLVHLRNFVNDLSARKIKGDIVECGAWKGGSSVLMFKKATRKKYDCNIWIFDSFEGFPAPAPAEIDGIKAQGINQGKYNWIKANVADVEKVFKKFGLLNNKVHIIKGWFNESIPGKPIKDIALLHCDGDLYESTKSTLDLLYHKVVSGGYIVSNDYGDVWIGAKKAFDECIALNCPGTLLTRIAGGGAYFKKP